MSPVKSALYAALGLFAFMMVRELIGGSLYSFDPLSFDDIWPSLFHSAMYTVGLFLALAFVTRISRRSSLLATIGGGALGAVFGGSLLFVFAWIWLLTSVPSPGMLSDLFTLFRGPLSSILGEFPLTVLAAVLVREWLRSRTVVDAPKEPVAAV